MGEVSIRELRNRGGEVIDRVARGERLVVTRDGHAVAELRPLGRPAATAGVLVERWSRLPKIDVAKLRADIDQVIDPRI
jgi:prevent-host-death family protein